MRKNEFDKINIPFLKPLVGFQKITQTRRLNNSQTIILITLFLIINKHTYDNNPYITDINKIRTSSCP